MATSTTSAIDIARSIMDAGNAHDFDSMASHYAEVIDEQMPDRVIRSPDQLRAYMNDLHTAMPDFRFDIHAMAEDGHKVIIRWTLTGTQQGVFEGIKPTGTKLSIRGGSAARPDAARRLGRRARHEVRLQRADGAEAALFKALISQRA